MEALKKESITIESTVNASPEKVWKLWSTPADICKWSNPSDDWHTTSAENDLRAGGKFLSRMEAKDGSFGFDFGGVYDNVKEHELIEYTMGDGRKVKTIFENKGNQIQITQTFEAETENSIEMQRTGWQAILDNFKKYTEAN